MLLMTHQTIPWTTEESRSTLPKCQLLPVAKCRSLPGPPSRVWAVLSEGVLGCMWSQVPGHFLLGCGVRRHFQALPTRWVGMVRDETQIHCSWPNQLVDRQHLQCWHLPCELGQLCGDQSKQGWIAEATLSHLPGRTCQKCPRSLRRSKDVHRPCAG